MKAMRVATLLILAAGITAGYAQEITPTGLSLRGGLFFPANGDARNEGKTWFGIGVDYKVGNMKFGEARPGFSSHWSLSADYYSKGDFSNTALLANLVQRNDQFYYLVGAGFGFTRTRPNANQTRKSTEFTYTLAVGWDWQKGSAPVFVEARWWGSAESRVNGFGIYVGFRF